MRTARNGARAPNEARGFTLIELLTALAVFGLILVTLRQGFSIGTNSLAVRTRLTDAQGDLEPVDHLLRHLVEAMDPGTYATPPIVKGDRQQLSFVTDLPSGSAAPLHADVTLMMQNHRLLLRWRPHAHAELFGPRPQPEDAVLAEHVERIEFAFAEAEQAGSWRGDWSSPSLPARVRLRVAFEPLARRRWPEITAIPRRERPVE